MVADTTEDSDDGGEQCVDDCRFSEGVAGGTLVDELLVCGGAGACRLRRLSVDMGDDKVEHSDDGGDCTTCGCGSSDATICGGGVGVGGAGAFRLPLTCK